MVFPHRECAFGAVAAPIPVYGLDLFQKFADVTTFGSE